MLTTTAGGPVLSLTDTVNVIGCPTVPAVNYGGTTDSTIEQRCIVAASAKRLLIIMRKLLIKINILYLPLIFQCRYIECVDNI